jgi:6-phosphogluconolactonase (cycloisomerase 2 family)
MTKARDIADGGGGESLGTVTANDVDLSTGNFFEITANDQTLTFSNAPAVHDFKFKLTGANTITGFDISSGSYDSVSFSVNSQETVPRSLAFNVAGTKMYIMGSDSKSIYQYTLTTGFDLSTASWDGAGYTFSVSGQDTTPAHLIFNDTGTKIFVVGLSSASIYQYDLTTGFDLSTASYSSVSLSVSSEDSTPRSLHFNGSGTKMYLIGSGSKSIYQYTLTTGFDLSTASYDSVSFSVNAQEDTPTDFVFNNDGTKFFVGGVNDTLYQYSLTTAFDISTASYDSVSFNVNVEEDTLMGFLFNATGTKLYIVGLEFDTVFQYSTAATSTTTITYPSSVKFPAATAPATPANGEIDTIGLYTIDSGTSYYLYLVSDNQS